MTSILSYASSPFCASLWVGSLVRVRGKFWPARKPLFSPNFFKGRKSLSASRSSGEEGKEKKLFFSSVSSPLHPYASVMIMIIIIYRTPLYWKLAGYVLGANLIPGLFNYRYKMGGTFSRPPIFTKVREKSQEQSCVGVGALPGEQQDYFVYLSFPVMTQAFRRILVVPILTRFLRFSNDSQLS